MSIGSDLAQLDKDLKSSKRFELLKDLPGLKAGEIFIQDPNEKIMIIPEKILQGGFLSPWHRFNLYCVEDDFKDFFKPIKK